MAYVETVFLTPDLKVKPFLEKLLIWSSEIAYEILSLWVCQGCRAE